MIRKYHNHTLQTNPRHCEEEPLNRISGTTAKSRQRKFVPSSHTGPVALVASPGKSKTKVGTLACFDFL